MNETILIFTKSYLWTRYGCRNTIGQDMLHPTLDLYAPHVRGYFLKVSISPNCKLWRSSVGLQILRSLSYPPELAEIALKRYR